MDKMLFSITILLLVIFISGVKKTNKGDIKLMSIKHTNILRGIGAIMVVISHMGAFSGLRYFTPLGGIGVAIFLMCSGYGLHISYSNSGLNGYFKKRLLKILIPYWIVVIIYNIINLNSIELSLVVKQLLLIRTIPYLWFVQLIIVEYVLFFIIYKLISSPKIRMYAIIVLSLPIFFVNNSLYAEQCLSFAIGIILAVKLNKIKDISKAKYSFIGLSMCFIGGVCLVLKQLPIADSHYLIYNTLELGLKEITAMGVICLSYGIVKFKIVNMFERIGKYSYEIYLTHTLMIFIIKNNYSFTNILIYISVVIVITYVLNMIVSKIYKNILPRI